MNTINQHIINLILQHCDLNAIKACCATGKTLRACCDSDFWSIELRRQTTMEGQYDLLLKYKPSISMAAYCKWLQTTKAPYIILNRDDLPIHDIVKSIYHYRRNESPELDVLRILPKFSREECRNKSIFIRCCLKKLYDIAKWMLDNHLNLKCKSIQAEDNTDSYYPWFISTNVMLIHMFIQDNDLCEWALPYCQITYDEIYPWEMSISSKNHNLIKFIYQCTINKSPIISDQFREMVLKDIGPELAEELDKIMPMLKPRKQRSKNIGAPVWSVVSI